MSSVHIVVRGISERTEFHCVQRASAQLLSANISLINETPFSLAVKRTFEIGIQRSKKWTLALDADIILREKAIRDITTLADSLPENFFMIQGRVLDKLFCFSRNGGPHLFRTSLLEQALSLVPSHTESIRPEGEAIKRMISKGFHRYKGTEVFGIHDFEQSYQDVFRTAFVHAIKFRNLIPYFKTEWEARKAYDVDYMVALMGLAAGASYEFQSMPDRDKINAMAQQAVTDLGLGTKPPLRDDYNADETMATFNISEEGKRIEQRDHNIVLRSDREQPKRSRNIIQKIPAYLKSKIKGW